MRDKSQTTERVEIKRLHCVGGDGRPPVHWVLRAPVARLLYGYRLHYTEGGGSGKGAAGASVGCCPAADGHHCLGGTCPVLAHQPSPGGQVPTKEQGVPSDTFGVNRRGPVETKEGRRQGQRGRAGATIQGRAPRRPTTPFAVKATAVRGYGIRSPGIHYGQPEPETGMKWQRAAEYQLPCAVGLIGRFV